MEHEVQEQPFPRKSTEIELHSQTLTLSEFEQRAEHPVYQRFGDFEQQYKACRKVTLGLPLALWRRIPSV